MKFATKLGVCMGAVALGSVIIGLFCLYQMQQINSKSTEISQNWMPSTSHIQRINTLMSDYRLTENNHVFSTAAAEMAQLEDELKTIMTEIHTNLDAYQKLMSTDFERQSFSTLNRQLSTYMELHTQLLGLSRQNKTAEAIALREGQSRTVYRALSSELMKLVKFNMAESTKASEAGDAGYAQAQMMVSVCLVLVVAFSIGCCLFLLRETHRNLGKDPAELRMLAARVAQGDLEVDKDDKAVGVYAEILNMVESLKKMIESAQQESERAHKESERAQEAMHSADAASKEAQTKAAAMHVAAEKLESVANIVSSASEELAAQIEQSERGAAQQASRVTETATAVEEMNSTVLEVARNASSAADISAQTKGKAEEGAHIVEAAVNAIGSVQRDSQALKTDMTTLAEHAQNISQIMSVISDIADQTNLLALNAAIEAARAGEAGRGFAVVADEVRKLAEKTMASTTDVGNAIRAIQQSADASTKQVETTVENVLKATSLSEKCGEALKEIVALADTTADQVRAIATASEQQSASSEEIAQSVTQVNTIAGETARAMQEASRAVEALVQQNQSMGQLINDMRQG